MTSTTPANKQWFSAAVFFTLRADDPDGEKMFVVYASPAGHPFCLGLH